VALAGVLAVVQGDASAASVIVVNSSSDVIAGGDGDCTLREAIISANGDVSPSPSPGECAAGSGTDQITFNISGAPDFTNDGQNGYRISLNSPLPSLIGPVHINGFSQPGALANTAPNPQPLNTRILIEVDGSSAGMTAGSGEHAFDFQPGAVASSIRGLAIMNMGLGQSSTGSNDPTAIGIGAPDVTVGGMYLGTDHTGVLDAGNVGCGVCQSSENDAGARIGGPNPADRNVIVGNDQTGISPNSGGDDWIVQGNYVGVAADGVTAIGNSTPGAAGALSIDNVDNFLLGGDELSEMNIISGNASMGVAPADTTNLRITGNRIGTDWSATAALPNGDAGILQSGGTDTVIGGSGGESNLISNNENHGIGVDSSTGTSIRGNIIGLAVDGSTAMGNDGQGISVGDGSSEVTIGGTTADSGNLISSNAASGIAILEASDVVMLGNRIGTDTTGLLARPNQIFGLNVGNFAKDIQIGNSTSAGANLVSGNAVANIGLIGLFSTPTDIRIQGNVIGPNGDGKVDPALTQPNAIGVFVLGEVGGTLIGGTAPGDGNHIAGNQVGGVVAASAAIDSAAFHGAPSAISILGNSIHDTVVGGTFPGTPNGSGIDLAALLDTSPVFTNVFDTYEDFGRNPLSATGDTPGEANDYLNHPVLTSAEVVDNTFAATFDLDASGSTTGRYRVEFFANSSGSGNDARNYLGSVDTAPGTGLTANLTYAGAGGLVGSDVTATATRITGSAPNGGFGATSELSDVISVAVGNNGTTTTTTTPTTTSTPATTTTVNTVDSPTPSSANSVAAPYPDNRGQTGNLALTGTNIWLMVLIGAAMVALGLAFAPRERRRNPSADRP
jgi:CSLREA domain-containing protein